MAKNVLLKFRHGLGDAVQFTVILRHLRHFRPDWKIDMWSLRGKHSAFHGLCRRSFHNQEPDPPGPYDLQLDLRWCENYNCYPDRPNSKITNCLTEVFKTPYNAGLGRYQVCVSPEAHQRARDYLQSIGALEKKAVLFHYQGNTSHEKKNLDTSVVGCWVDLVKVSGYVPVILDWDRRSPLPDNRTVFNPGIGPGDLWGNFGSGDAEMLSALISEAAAFVGIDSGPGKCASATETPTLICWHGMHPVQFHDPAPNTLHLVPGQHRDLPPAQHPAIADFFERHYQFRTYEGAHPGFRANSLALKGYQWLEEIMHNHPLQKENLAFVFDFWVPRHNPAQAWTIIEDVLNKDAYRTALRPLNQGTEYVVDIGANIGAFARLWHQRNSQARIACVEVHPLLVEALKINAPFATVIHAACHYDAGLHFLDAICPGSDSIGGSRVIDEANFLAMAPDSRYEKVDLPAPAQTLEQILQQANFPRADILKLDCEGSEFAILENCDLSKVGTIFVESHNKRRWRALLAKCFQGWDIGHMYESPDNDCEIWHLVNPARV